MSPDTVYRFLLLLTSLPMYWGVALIPNLYVNYLHCHLKVS